MLTQFLQLFSLNGIGQVLYGVSGLVIVKFISIENYGIVACVLAFTNFCSSIATGRYDIPILYEKGESKRQECIKLCYILIPTISVVCSLWGFCLQKFLFKGLVVNFGILLVFFILIVNSSLFELVIRKIYIHEGKFKQLSYLLFTNYLLRSGLPFALLHFWRDWRCCILSETIAVTISCGIFMLNNSNLKTIKFDLGMLMRTLREYNHYPKYQLPSTILDNVSFATITPTLNFLFGNTIAGQFALVYRILLIPLSLLGKIIGDFYQHNVCIAIQHKNLLRCLSQYTKVFALTSIFIYAIILLGGLIFYKLGNSFKEFFYLWPMLILALVQFIVSPLSGVLLANADGVRYKMFYDSFNYIFILLTFGITFLFQFNHYICIKILACVLTGTYIFYYFLIYYYVRNFRYTDN